MLNAGWTSCGRACWCWLSSTVKRAPPRSLMQQNVSRAIISCTQIQYSLLWLRHRPSYEKSQAILQCH